MEGRKEEDIICLGAVIWQRGQQHLGGSLNSKESTFSVRNTKARAKSKCCSLRQCVVGFMGMMISMGFCMRHLDFEGSLFIGFPSFLLMDGLCMYVHILCGEGVVSFLSER